MYYSLKNIPDQPDRVAVITGANVGLGYEVAKALAQKKLYIVLACRNLDKANSAINRIHKVIPTAKLTALPLDLCSFQSIRNFQKNFCNHFDRLDLLINNAGVMMPPYRLTEDGLESQMCSNYFGHFFLTSLLLPKLEQTSGSRIIALSSLSHAWNDLNYDNLNSQQYYNPRKVYGQSKLACLMFAYELARKLRAKKFQTQSLAAHPGVTITEIGRNIHPAALLIGRLVSPLIFQKPFQGAWPILRAALDPEAANGEHYGPGGFRQYKGAAVKVSSNRISRDEEKAEKLWTTTEQLLQIKFFQ